MWLGKPELGGVELGCFAHLASNWLAVLKVFIFADAFFFRVVVSASACSTKR